MGHWPTVGVAVRHSCYKLQHWRAFATSHRTECIRRPAFLPSQQRIRHCYFFAKITQIRNKHHGSNINSYATGETKHHTVVIIALWWKKTSYHHAVGYKSPWLVYNWLVYMACYKPVDSHGLFYKSPHVQIRNTSSFVHFAACVSLPLDLPSTSNSGQMKGFVYRDSRRFPTKIKKCRPGDVYATWNKQLPWNQDVSRTGSFWKPFISRVRLSHEKNPPTFYYTGWLIGILMMVYYNALYNWVVFHPLCNPTNQGFFHCSFVQLWRCFATFHHPPQFFFLAAAVWVLHFGRAPHRWTSSYSMDLWGPL